MTRYKFIILIFFLVMVFDSKNIFSQKKISLGIKGGFSQTGINIQNNFFPVIIETSNLNSYNYSILSEIMNKNNVGIRLEINMVKKGYFQEFSSGEKLFSKINYINIPFLLHYYLLDNKQSVYINLGPYLEYLLKVTSQNIPSTINASEVYFFDDKRDNKLGYGLKFSIGLSTLMKMNKIQLDFSYMYNFSNLISPDYKSDLVPDVSNFNTLSISLVYLFNFTKNEI